LFAAHWATCEGARRVINHRDTLERLACDVNRFLTASYRSSLITFSVALTRRTGSNQVLLSPN
jgi:hypothetical protein